MRASDYLAHPAAELFPLYSEEALADLAADIAAHGQREPIRLLRGRILDGRNRLRACELLGIDPICEDLPDDTDPWAYVWSLNGLRRHLTDSQRALIGARIVQQIQAARAAGADMPAGASAEGRARDQAAAMVHVSPRSVADATKVLAEGAPVLAAAVEAGKLPVSVAAKATDLSASAQASVVRQVEAGAKPASAVREAKEKAEARASKRQPQTTKREPLQDRLSAEVPDHLRDVFGDPWLADLLRDMDSGAVALAKQATNWARLLRGKSAAYAAYLRAGESLEQLVQATEALDEAREHVRAGVPYAVCSGCRGALKGCDRCRKQGWVPQWRQEELKNSGEW